MKACGPRNSRKMPAYSKSELVELAIKRGLKKTHAQKMTKLNLCEYLNFSAVTRTKLTKLSKKGNCILRSKLPLRDHQKKVVEHMQNNRGLVAAFSVGSGKTLAAVTTSQCYLDANPNGRVIVVTPVSLQENFKKEMRAYGVSDDRKYEFLTLQKFANKYVDRQCGKGVFLIIDEAHNLRTEVSGKKGRRSSVAIRCARTVDKVLLLTATTIYNQPYDLANLVAMVRGEPPLSRLQFETLLDSSKLFKKYFRCTMSFFEKQDKENYPSVKEHYVKIPMTAEYYKDYHRVEVGKSSLLRSKNPFLFLNGVRQASNAIKTCLKCDWVMKKVREHKKTVIYSSFLDFGIRKIQDILKKDKIKFVEVTGKMSKKKRQAAVDKYNSNEVNVLFITRAGGEGLDLKGTRNEIIFESAWNRPNEEQIIGRAVRFHSHSHLPKDQRHVDVYHLIIVKPKKRAKGDTYPSADEMVMNILNDKKKEIEPILKKLRKISIEKLGGGCKIVTFEPIKVPAKKRKRKARKATKK